MTKANNRMNTDILRECKLCRSLFESTDYRRKYCCSKCSDKAQRLQRAEYLKGYYQRNKAGWNKYRKSKNQKRDTP